jgi:acetyltransferase-like isoleucine patch superfamily enzyme
MRHKAARTRFLAVGTAPHAVVKYATNHLVSKSVSAAARRWWYRGVLGWDVAADAEIGLGMWVQMGGLRRGRRRVRIGAGAHLGPGVRLHTGGGIVIGPHARLAAGTCLISGGHDIEAPDFRVCYAPIILGAHVYLGRGTTVLGGVTIGDWATILAGSVVTHDIPPGTIAVGVPAHVLD